MLDAFIIEYLKEKAKKDRGDKRIPLQLPVPERPEAGPGSSVPNNTNKKGYIEIVSEDETDSDRGVIIIDI